MTPTDMNNFNDLSDDQQHQVIAQAMRNENIQWNIVLAELYPQFKDKEFLSNLIHQYKHGLGKQSLTSSKRPIDEVSPSKQDKVAAGLAERSIEVLNTIHALMEATKKQHLLPPALDTNNGPTIHEGETNQHGYLNVNEVAGNFEKSSGKTQRLLMLRF